MDITPEELGEQAASLAQACGLNTPEQIGTIVIFIDRNTGNVSMRAVKLTKEQVHRAVKHLLKGYGSQIITEGVDL